jgi:Uracil phosphoribosyltransferase
VICVIGSNAGIRALVEEHPDIILTVGTIDENNATDGSLIPGLGDAGDRLFGSHISTSNRSNSTAPGGGGVSGDDEDEALMLPSRRKRAYSQQQE